MLPVNPKEAAKYPEGTTVWAVNVCLFPHRRRMYYEEIEGEVWDETWAVEADTPEQAITIAGMIATGMEGSRIDNGGAYLTSPHMVKTADRTVNKVPTDP